MPESSLTVQSETLDLGRREKKKSQIAPDYVFKFPRSLISKPNVYQYRFFFHQNMLHLLTNAKIKPWKSKVQHERCGRRKRKCAFNQLSA